MSWFQKRLLGPAAAAVARSVAAAKASPVRLGTTAVGAAKIGTVLSTIQQYPILTASLPGKLGAAVLIAGTVYQTFAKPALRVVAALLGGSDGAKVTAVLDAQSPQGTHAPTAHPTGAPSTQSAIVSAVGTASTL